MAILQRVLVLTGGRAGRSCLLGRQFRFVEGRLQLSGDEVQIEKLTRYIGRCYKAFPEGTAELAHYQKLDQEEAQRNGTGQVLAHPEPGGPTEVPSPVRQDGAGPPPIPPNDGSGANNSPAGPAGSIPSGDGQPDAGIDGETQLKDRLFTAVKSLDPTNDEHWTAEGLPRIDAIESAYGKTGVSRAMVEEVAPGFTR